MYKSILAALALCSIPARGDLVISEFLASNSGISLLDEDGVASDWIEIRNTGASAVPLAGYRITDDATNLSKWTFPAVSIPAGGYLVIFASSNDRAVAGSQLHTNFKLSASGEYLGLIDPSGTVLHEYSPTFPTQEEDISYGIGPDGTTNGYFVSPTPGAANSVSIAGRVADTAFSVDRGIFTSSFSVEITTETVGAQIRYTTNGSTPTATTGTVYSTPLTISQTTVLRAAAFKSGLFPTNVDTQTYLFPSDVRTQYANGNAPAGWPSSSVNGQVYDYGMDPDITGRYTAQEMETALKAIPSVMLTTDVANLTNATTGIYSNPAEDGSAWERMAHIEIIGDGMTPAVSSPCGLRIRGGASRTPNNPKHSFRVFFRSEYGNGKLNYPMFGTEGVDEFDKFDFRTAQNYSWSKDGNTSTNTFLRDVLSRDLQGAMGQPYTRSRYYHLYLNGVYWGLFMTQERSEADWGGSYLGGDPDDFDAMKSSGSDNSPTYATVATDGNLNGAWRTLWDLSKAQLANPSTTRYYQMQGLDANGNRDPSLPVLLDVDNLIDYMLLIGFTGAYDNSLSSFVGASNNWYSVRDRLGSRGFVHLMHDAEHSLGAGGSRWNNNNNRITTTNGAASRSAFNKSNPQFLHMDLADSTPEYRLRFADRAHARLFNNGALAKDNVLAALEARREVVGKVIIAESARWGDAHSSRTTDPADEDDWKGAVSSLNTLIDGRTDVFLGHLKGGGLYPENTAAPTFSPFADKVIAGNSVLISAPIGTIYYTTDGSDPRLANGNPNPAALSLSYNATTEVFAKNSVWSFDDSGTDRGSSATVSGVSGYSSANWKHPNFNLTGWKSGAGILGFGELGPNTTAITPPTQMGLGTASGGSNPSTCYLRRNFNISGAASVSAINASVLADDGVIIYLNGAEVYRSNIATGAVTYSTYATSSVNNADEVAYTSFTINPLLLVEGQNVLAAEIHQISAGSSDIGFDMDLSVQNPTNQGYVVNSPTILNARVLNNGEWSALTSNYFSTADTPLPGELAISEVHYHPANPGTPAELAASTDDSDFEFIELTNISSKYLELRGVRLAEQVINDHLEGVRYTFATGLVLSPGQRISIVADRTAFLARYPGTADAGIGGEYAGNLGNSGEWLELRNAEGTIIASFRYNDLAPWPTDADGNGMSLQLVTLNKYVDYSDPYSWMAITNNGSPSVSGSGLFTGSPSSDDDHDGVSSLVEYFSGTADDDESFPLPQELSLKSETNEDGVYFTFTRDPEAFGISAVIQQSDNLGSWGAPPAGSTLVKRVVLPGNLVRETYRIASGAPGFPSLFVRLSVSLTD
ncbi:MAG: lamin tail domain-containing protein [Akkermansiaceae bacterium]|nr:lamin tail domain-containing protein [Akkermansiaceae bacterium]MDP4646010.1 lamin tail domain-containing protein [Akkermansiaceae bacterium]MDP4721878.1 lamin tail domain-containing protein [Akkermansiaceae bacterium]MDP4780130.1 lamin tail domain-containing protein [Akkermansiaceae bacterium]MDP4848585.1 lamin tail domain-containing protein [Akkermansiaceae bacterium]